MEIWSKCDICGRDIPVGELCYGLKKGNCICKNCCTGFENCTFTLAPMSTLTPPNEKPPCYLPEKDNPYPLCEGRGMKACAHCCLWENYDPEEDEGRVNRPLTLKQLREMEYPVWCVCKTVEGFEGFWCLCNHGYILTPARQIFDVKEIPHWVFYRRPPEEEKL